MKSLLSLKQKVLKNPEVKKEYEQLNTEFKLIDKLLAMRESAGLTQEQVAEKMGTTRGNICRLEKLGVHPKVSTIEKYAHACGFKMIFQFKPA